MWRGFKVALGTGLIFNHSFHRNPFFGFDFYDVNTRRQIA